MSTWPFSRAWLDVHINEPAINKDVRQIRYKASTLTGDNKIAWLLKAISFIDLTTLNSDDTSSNVEYLCKKAAKPMDKIPFKWDKPLRTAAVCVYPSRISDAITALNDIDERNTIKVASVAGGFPSGQYPLESRIDEVRRAIDYGADEIDIVINRSLALNHKWNTLYDELISFRTACTRYKNSYKDTCMKTILATGELFDLKDVYKASIVAMMGGTDFIKTSTGKESINATLPVGIVMCRAIKDFQELTEEKIGFKPAGGIKTAQDALEWMVLVKEELGNDWLTNSYFRIGASSLLDSITSEIVKTYNSSSD